jgi:hypothetical protein
VADTINAIGSNPLEVMMISKVLYALPELSFPEI